MRLSFCDYLTPTSYPVIKTESGDVCQLRWLSKPPKWSGRHGDAGSAAIDKSSNALPLSVYVTNIEFMNCVRYGGWTSIVHNNCAEKSSSSS